MALHRMCSSFSGFYCRLLTFFKINFFQKILSGTLSECQMVWIQIRTFLPILFAKVINRRQKLSLATKELKNVYKNICMQNVAITIIKTSIVCSVVK